MADYKKAGLNSNLDADSRYKSTVQRLKNFMSVKEIDQRHRSRDCIGNPDHALFKIIKYALIPLFSLFLFFTMTIYCFIRKDQVDYNYMLSYEPDTEYVGVILTMVIIYCALILAGNILLFIKKHIIGSIITGASTLCITIHILTQLSIPMGPESNYVKFFAVCSIFYGIFILLCGYLLFCELKVKITVKKMTEDALLKITRSNSSMVSTEEFTLKIDEYIEKEKNKMVNQMNSKNHNFLRFADDEIEE